MNRLPTIVAVPTGLAAENLLRSEPLPSLSAEQSAVLREIVEPPPRHHQCIIVNGFAGSGKSAILRHLIEMSPSEVQTIHMLCASNAGDTAAQWLMSVKSNSKFDLTLVKTVIIDEWSMVSGLQFNKLSSLFRHFQNKSKPFGGVRLVLFGDCLQLPPVHDQSVVDTAVFAKLSPKIVWLKELFRYDSADLLAKNVFVSILREISTAFVKRRPLTPYVAANFDYLLCEPSRIPPCPQTSLYLFATNELREEHNRTTAAESGVPAQAVLVSSVDKLEAPLETGVALYAGAPVVIRRNVYTNAQDEKARRLLAANGTTGHFVRCVGPTAKVFNHNATVYSVFAAGPKLSVVVRVNGDEVELPAIPPILPSENPTKRRKRQYEWPLQPGFAQTIHSMQGTTCSGRIHVDFRGVRFTEPANQQLPYVGLSRARSFSQLSVSGLDSGIVAAVVKELAKEELAKSAQSIQKESLCDQLGTSFFLPQDVEFTSTITSESSPQVIGRLCEIAQNNNELEAMLQHDCLELKQEHGLPGWFIVKNIQQ